MEVTVDNRVQEELTKIEWLEKIGEKEKIELELDSMQFKNVKEIAISCKKINWENIVLDGRNEISIKLLKQKSLNRNKWNEYVKEGKQFWETFLKKIISKKLMEKLGEIDEAILSDIKSQLISIYIYKKYKDELNDKCFINNLLKVYKKGHLPCGWQEKQSDKIRIFDLSPYNIVEIEDFKSGILLYY